jgi:hypothetical protein
MRSRIASALVVFGLASCAASATEAPSATVVLFDASNSTRTPAVRARYEATFDLVLAHVRATGGVLGADVIDDNPMVHGALPVNVVFEPCTITDNSLDCREALDETEAGVRGEADAILANSSRGTDVFGGLALAAQFYEAYPDAGARTLVVLSDMVQSANGMHLGRLEDWSEAQITALLAEAPEVDLASVHVYVIGAGATTLVGTTPTQVEGIERFWARWFQAMGATVEFYGANLARFPIERGAA